MTTGFGCSRSCDIRPSSSSTILQYTNRRNVFADEERYDVTPACRKLSMKPRGELMRIRYWIGLAFVMVISLAISVESFQTNGVQSLQVRDQNSVDIFKVEIDPISAKISSKPTQISQDFPGRSMYPRFFSNGKMLSYVVTSRGNQIVVRSYPKGKDQVVPVDFDQTRGMTWTPDDTLIVLGVPKGGTTLGYYRVDWKTGKSTLFLSSEFLSSDAPAGSVNGRSAIGIPEFGLDGKMYYRDDRRHAVLVRNNQTGAERVLYQQSGPDFPQLRGVHPSPNGKWVAFVERNNKSGHGLSKSCAHFRRSCAGANLRKKAR